MQRLLLAERSDCDICAWPFNRQIIQFKFSPTWSCVSLARSTASSGWKLFRFDKMELNSFQIFLIDLSYLKFDT